MRYATLALLLSCCGLASAQSPDLIGYWHNWNDPAAPYMDLSAIDPRYTIIEVSFATPAQGTTYRMEFSPAETTMATFLADVTALQAQGRKVLISIGGANATVHLNSDAERDEFTSSLLAIMDTYGFDGLDIDLEGSSVSLSGGSIASPIDPTVIRLIDAIHNIADQYESDHGRRMLLTMAPETAYVQGGQSAFGGIWGAYLPIIDALRDRLDILQVQLYNSGSMYGIDGSIYEQSTTDFIVSQTEALLQGFQTSGGFFAPLPPEKVAIGLPACPSAAGGGYVTPGTLAEAVHYLREGGTPPGNFISIGTYPTLRGLMTWSVNWDAVGDCAVANEYAQSYEDLFQTTNSIASGTPGTSIRLWPNVLHAGDMTRIEGMDGIATYLLMDLVGRKVAQIRSTSGLVQIPSTLQPGTYRVFGIEGAKMTHVGSLVVL